VADAKKYDQARNLSEKALEAIVDGDEDKAAKLVKQAEAADPQALKDIAQELDEDADSEHDPGKISKELGTDPNKA
jgi:methanogenic corrinoid protein MtbC1